jgi:hypothetical protein
MLEVRMCILSADFGTSQDTFTVGRAYVNA